MCVFQGEEERGAFGIWIWGQSVGRGRKHKSVGNQAVLGQKLGDCAKRQPRAVAFKSLSPAFCRKRAEGL